MQPTATTSPNGELGSRCLPIAVTLPNDFVAGDTRIVRVHPLIARLMDIGMADAAIKNIDLDIIPRRRHGVRPLTVREK